MIKREVLFRLLQGPEARTLRRLASDTSRIARIERAVDWLRRNFAEPVRIETLAKLASMSLSTFHEHFKAVTTMTPLQFQKQMRLQEARRLLLTDRGNTSRVGFAVGYENQSQFSREYRRMFGVPPGRDALQLGAVSKTRS